MRTIYCWLFWFSLQQLLAQTPAGFDANANLTGAATHMFRSFDNRYEGIHGVPTIFKTFVKGKVKLKGGDVATNQGLNYDAMTDELLVESKKKDPLVARTDMVESFTFYKTDTLEEMNFVKVELDGKPGYLQVLWSSKMTFYKKHGKIIEKANYGGGYNNNARRYDEFVETNKYYLKIGDKDLQEFKPGKNGIEKLLPERSVAIREYAKLERTSLRKEKDIIGLLTYLEAH